MLIADLHIHSKYSYATSRDGVPEVLDLWARRKGIGLLGTGDFTHPAWREELAAALVPAGDGLYALKRELRLPDGPDGEAPRFVVSGEISCIYRRDGKSRKVHNLILLPGLPAAEALSRRLEAIGNLCADGRPILSIDSRDLLEMTLDVCPEAIFVPAHIWTPHFSVFGAFSRFSSLEECFGDLTPYVRALETGLSSDPPMNWRCSMLDGRTLISNSDAHSPGKLGREANLLDIPLSYEGLYRAVQTGEGMVSTLEFFPEHGKYHLDGHRGCGLRLSPGETEALRGICPVCGKKLTVGVAHRVEALADREEGFVPEGARPYERLSPLAETVAAAVGVSAEAKRVKELCGRLLKELGPEFSLLREVPIEDIRAVDSRAGEAVRCVREGRIEWAPGFDGEYGRMRLLL